MRSIAMVISAEGETSPFSMSLVSKFSDELFLSEGQRRAFVDTQVEFNGEVTTNTDKYTNMALLYLCRKATEEVKEFNSSDVVEKIGVEVDGVLLNKGRIMNEMEFLVTGEIDVDLGYMGIRTRLPIVDRHSPLAYSIASYVHWDLAVHRGAETCSRISMEQVSIIQGAALYTVKWYRGHNEFFRFVPADTNKMQIFVLPGVVVDVSKMME